VCGQQLQVNQLFKVQMKNTYWKLLMTKAEVYDIVSTFYKEFPF